MDIYGLWFNILNHLVIIIDSISVYWSVYCGLWVILGLFGVILGFGMDIALYSGMKLTKRHNTTKDNRGCEFPYTIYTSWEYNDIPAKYNEIVERIYVADWFDIKADSLKELKDKVSQI